MGAARREGLPHRLSLGSVRRTVSAAAEGLPGEASGPGLCGRPKPRLRVPVGRRSIRTASGPGEGTGASQRGPDVHSRRCPPALAAKAATKTIPIVFFAGDAVESGLVSSLARPGGNLTGISGLTAGLDAKRLEILKEAVPTATRVAILWNPENLTGVPQRNRIALAAQALKVEPRMLEARSPAEIDQAFAAAARERADAVLVLADPMLTSQRKRIVALATRARLPLAAYFRTFTEAGALVSYG